jgi:hypothetical protein
MKFFARNACQIKLSPYYSRPAVANVVETDFRDLQEAPTKVLTVLKSDVEWAAHLGRNVLGRYRENRCQANDL